MSGLMSWLARVGRPLVLLDAALLFGGVMLTAFNLLLIGWTVYAIAWVLAIVAFLAIAAMYRDRMDGWSWAGLLVLELGLILSLPQVYEIWQSYTQTPTGAEMLLPAQTYPIGLAAQTVVWVGLAFYGLAARGAKALPAGVGWIFLVAAVMGLLADYVNVLFITPLWWVPAMLIMILGLVVVGGSLSESAQRAVETSSSSAVPESAL